MFCIFKQFIEELFGARVRELSIPQGFIQEVLYLLGKGLLLLTRKRLDAIQGELEFLDQHGNSSALLMADLITLYRTY
jgi:hypothetical protein